MKKLKMNLDRKPLNSEFIESKQNFNQVLNGFKQLKPPIWKNPWFYGPIGVASLALFFSINSTNANPDKDEDKTTFTTNVKLPEDTKCIVPPTEKLEMEYLTYTINPSKEENITLPSGTIITIPKESLTTSSKEGDVVIKIREFNDKASSFVAGIPMDYSDQKSFESAGMIEIRGFQNEKVVEISPLKPIEVKMILTKDPDNFTFWKLDESKKEWKDYPAVYSQKSTGSEVKNTRSQSTDSQNKTLIQLEKVQEELSSLVAPKRVDFSLPIQGNQKFDLEFDAVEFPELEKFKGMEFEVVSAKKYDKSFTKKTWSSVNLVKENQEYFALFASKTDKFKIAVRPVLNGKKKEIAELELDKSMAFYSNKKEELEKSKLMYENQIRIGTEVIGNLDSKQVKLNAKSLQVDRMMEQSNVPIADFKVRSFGVFNCDHPIDYPQAFAEEVAFSFFSNATIEIRTAYVFDKDKDLRYSFGANCRHSISELGVNEKSSNTLVVVDKEGRLGYFLDFNSKSMKNGSVKLTLIEPKDENLNFIQKIVDETPVSS